MLRLHRLLSHLSPLALLLMAVPSGASPGGSTKPGPAASAAAPPSRAPAADPKASGISLADLPRPMRLEYHGPPGQACPDEFRVRLAISNEARTEPFSADAPVLLKVTATRKGRYYTAHLEVRDATGELLRDRDGNVFMDRVLEPELTCGNLVAAIGFIIGEKMRPKASDAPAPAKDAPPAPVAPAALPTPPGSANPARPPESEPFGDDDRMRGRWSMGGVFALGFAPTVGIGPSIAMGFQWRRFSMIAEGRVLLTPNFSVDPDHQLWALIPLGILSLCFQVGRWRAPLHSLEICALMGAGRLSVQTVQSKADPNYFVEQAHPFELMTGLRVPFVWQPSKRYSEFYLRSFLEGGFSLVRNHISFNNDTTWDPFPQFMLTVGAEASIVSGHPRAWSEPEPDEPASSARSKPERRYW